LAQNRILKHKQPSTHRFPNLLTCRDRNARHSDAVQMGPECGGEISGLPMTDICHFVQQTHNFIVLR
jgi:hypothetical protein